MGATRSRIHRRLAYVPGDVALWPNLSGGETIDMLMRMRGADPRRHRGATELLERFAARPDQEGPRLLQGQPAEGRPGRRVRRPTSELLILDEPTSGLDPLMEQVFNECVAEHTAAGATVLLSSHILSEVERLADRVTIIREGRAVETGTLEDCATCAATRCGPRSPAPVPDLDRDARRARRRRRRRSGDLLGRPRRTAGVLDALTAAGVRRTDEHPADARGAVPRRLPATRAGPRRQRPASVATGTGRWSRLALRRDRVMVPVWMLVLVAGLLRLRRGDPDLYPTDAERVTAAEAINASPAIVALYGPILDVHSLGELAMTKMTVLYAVFVAVLFMVLVRRHTRGRGGERAGRADRRHGGRVATPRCAAAVLEALRWRCRPRACWRRASNVAGLPRRRVAGVRRVLGGRRARGAGLTAVACQLSASARTCAGIAAAGDRGAVRAARRRGHLGLLAELARRPSAGPPSCAPTATPAGGCCCCTSSSRSRSSGVARLLRGRT